MKYSLFYINLFILGKITNVGRHIPQASRHSWITIQYLTEKTKRVSDDWFTISSIRSFDDMCVNQNIIDI
jgi:hypothetical protein